MTGPGRAPFAFDLEPLEAALGYRFHDRRLLEQALTHGSAQDQVRGTNERLEFLGDAMVQVAASLLLFHAGGDLSEGVMTKARARLVSRRHLAALGERLGLRERLQVGPMFRGRREISAALISNALEAVFGAVALDGGTETAVDRIRSLLLPDLQLAVAGIDSLDWKGRLGHVVRTELGGELRFLLLSALGPDHSKSFECAVEIDGRGFPAGYGRSKREAEQRAAWAALRTLGRVGPGP
jgi:ribonuclease-3